MNYIGTTLHLYYVYAHVSYAIVILNPHQCEAAGMMESSGSSFYASCGGGFMQWITVLNPPQCEAAGMMESGGSSFYASCGGGFM